MSEQRGIGVLVRVPSLSFDHCVEVSATSASLRTVMDLVAWRTHLAFHVDHGVVSSFALVHEEDFTCEITGTDRPAGFYTLAAGTAPGPLGKAARPTAKTVCSPTELTWEVQIMDGDRVVQDTHDSWQEAVVYDGWFVEWACTCKGKPVGKASGSTGGVSATSESNNTIRLDVPGLGFSRSVEVGGDSVKLKDLFQAAEASDLVWTEVCGSLEKLGVIVHSTPVSTSISSVVARSADWYGQRWYCEVLDEFRTCVLRIPQSSGTLAVSVVLPASSKEVICRCLSFSTRPEIPLHHSDAWQGGDYDFEMAPCPLRDPPYCLNDYRLLSSSVGSIGQVETDIAELCNSTGDVLCRATPHFFHILKNSCPGIVVERVVEAINVLLSGEEEQPVSFKSYLRWLYLSSLPELRCALLAQVMQAWPVPLAFPGVSDVTFCQELSQCAPETPGLLSFKLGTDVRGVSQLLNKLFYTRFEEEDPSAAGTIDLQYDEFAAPGRGFAVADAHGSVSLALIERLAPRFQFFSVHVAFSEVFGSQVRKALRSVLQVLMEAPRCRCVLVLLRDVPSSFAPPPGTPAESRAAWLAQQLDLGLDPEALGVRCGVDMICNLEGMPDKRTKPLINELRKRLMSSLLPHLGLQRSADGSVSFSIWDAEGGTFTATDIAELAGVGQRALSAVELLMTVAREKRGLYHTRGFLPCYASYVEFCRLRKELHDPRTLENYSDWIECNVICDESRQMMANKDKTPVLRPLAAFLDILRLVGQPGNALLHGYSELLRQLSNFNRRTVQELRSQEGDLFHQLHRLEMDHAGEDERRRLRDELKFVAEESSKTVLPVEVLWRECTQMIEQENPHLKSEQDTVVEAICDLMESGAPCEIVDGDNNYFSKRVLSKVGALLDQRRAARRKGSMPPCVVCLIGPQSSGKSMLANSLFGCQFAVSEGRCTRGIYGSVVPANVEGEQDLFVLDTEGLLSIEKGDPEFDRFMFLFCLAVSEVVIINVKGNLSEPMKQLLAVCVRALRHLEIAKVSSPSIFVVLNQMADTNRDHHIQAFQVIEQELIKMFKDDDVPLRSLLDITRDQLHIFPGAFAEERLPAYESLPVSRLSRIERFIDTSLSLSQAVLQQVCGKRDRLEKPFTSLTSFFEFATDVWNTITRFPNLTHFASIQQVRLEGLLNQWIRHRIEVNFTLRQAAIEEDICRTVDGVVLSTDIPTVVATLFESVRNPIDRDFAAEMSGRKCPPELTRSMTQHLAQVLDNRRQSWLQIAQRYANSKKARSAKQKGDDQLRQAILRICSSGMAVNPEAEFEKEWANIKSSMVADFEEKAFVHGLLQNIHRQYPKEHQLKAFNDLWKDAEVLEENGEGAVMELALKTPLVNATLRGDRGRMKPYPEKEATYVDILNVLRRCALQQGEKRNPWDVVCHMLNPGDVQCGQGLIGSWTVLNNNQFVQVYRDDEGDHHAKFNNNNSYRLKPPGRMLRHWILSIRGNFWLTSIDPVEGIAVWQRKKLVKSIFTDDTDHVEGTAVRPGKKLVKSVKSFYVDVGDPIVWQRVESRSDSQWTASLLSTLISASPFASCVHRKPAAKPAPREQVVSYLAGRRDAPVSTHDLQNFARDSTGWDRILHSVKVAVQEEAQCTEDEVRSDVSDNKSVLTDGDLNAFLEVSPKRSVRPVDPVLIHAVCCRLQSIVDHVNGELRFLSCELSIHGKGFVHALGALLLWKTVKQHELDTILLPIVAFDKEKGPQRAYFLEAVKGGDSADVANAQSLARHLASSIKENMRMGARGMLTGVFAQADGSLTRRALQRELDWELLGSGDDTENQLLYIKDPFIFFRRKFEQRYASLEQQAQARISDVCSAEVNKMKQIVSRIRLLAQEPGFADGAKVLSEDMFVLASDPGDPLRARRLKEMCMVRYLMDVLADGRWDLHVLDDEQEWTAAPVDGMELPCCEAVDVSLRPLLQEVAPSHFPVHCPAVFLTALFRSLQAEVETLVTARQDAASLEPGMKDRLLQRALGCRAKCPTCHRVCDDPHDVPGGKHRCGLGHQLRGMAGVHLEDDVRTASTKPCSRIQDVEFIVDTDGERITWKAFKMAHPEWDFEFYAQDDVCENEAKFFRSWMQIGPTITEEYGIRFTASRSNLRVDASHTQHWIFVNDTSSSMTLSVGNSEEDLRDASQGQSSGWDALLIALRMGQPSGALREGQPSRWDALLKALREAFQRFPESSDDVVTFINFSDSATRVLVRGSVEEAKRKLDDMPFPGGGTNFDEALSMALTVMNEASARDARLHHFLVFMSDGEGTFNDASSRFSSAPLWSIKRRHGEHLSSYFIGFGPGRFPQLRSAATHLGGTFSNSMDEVELANTYAEIMQPQAREDSSLASRT